MISSFFGGQRFRPWSSWMQDVPTRAAHIAAAFTRSVVAKTVDDGIPHGFEVVDKKSFRKRDPYRHQDQVTAFKLHLVEVVRLID